MTTGLEIISAARGWIDTPFHHQARLKKVGCDCVGLLVGVAHELGLQIEDRPGYAKQPDGSLQPELDSQLDRVTGDWQAGDVLLMQFAHYPSHVGFYTGSGVIHAYQPLKKVTEHSLNNSWLRRIVAVYRIRGLE